MASRLKQILQRSLLGVPRGGGEVRVLVRLRASATPHAACIERLESLGLSVRQTVDDTVIGAIEPSRLDALRADPGVAQVEPAVPLDPHRRAAGD